MYIDHARSIICEAAKKEKDPQFKEALEVAMSGLDAWIAYDHRAVITDPKGWKYMVDDILAEHPDLRF